jgi:acetoin utilization deacetylase AcuC-like enzyme
MAKILHPLYKTLKVERLSGTLREKSWNLEHISLSSLKTQGARLSQAKTAVAIVESKGHLMTGHPESPERFRYFDRFKDGPLADDLVFVDPVEVQRSQLEGVHSRAYLDELRQAVDQGPGLLDLGDTYVTRASFDAAQRSAGAALAVVEYALEHEGGRGFALARPPGHHATAFKGMGFCLINNIALAAKHALDLGLERIMIIDFDVHHGNGTQDIFYDDPQVMYLSTHEGGIYPGTGSIQETGSGPGQGTTINIPLPPKAGNGAFEAIFSNIIRPAARKYRPQILLISAGYDAHWQDPLAYLQLTSQGYQALSNNLVALADELCSGQIVFILEGGYNPQALYEGVRSALQAMAGQPSTDESQPDNPVGSEPDITPILEAVKRTHGLSERP